MGFVIDKVKKATEDIQVTGSPAFYTGWFWDTTEELNAESVAIATQGNKLPMVHLHLDIQEELLEDLKGFAEADVNIYIINETEDNTSNIDRHDNLMPSIRTIRDDLIKYLRYNGVRFNTVTNNELFFNQNESNQLDRNMDVIHINISDFNYYKNCE
jgi:hypothetical protein